MTDATVNASKTDNGPRKGGTRYAHPTQGFGVPDTIDPHHYIVQVPRGAKQPVLIHEELGTEADALDRSVIDRAQLERHRWTAIADPLKRSFNARLKARNLATSRWKVGDNPVDRLFGKELCVLAWAIEEVHPEKIPLAVHNWLALRPEERWWLFSMTAAVTGGAQDGGRGWRMALRYALADTSQGEPVRPRLVAKPGDSLKDTNTGTLFD